MRVHFMYGQSQLYNVPMGRRIIERKSRGRAQLSPAVIPEFVAWLRMVGERYIELLTALPSSRVVHSDAFLASMRQTTEFRISLIQDLINTMPDAFSHQKYLSAWSTTCNEMGITDQDTNPANYDTTCIVADGEGI